MPTIDILKEVKDWISTLGFPIAMCYLMWRKITDSDEKQSNLLTELIKAITELTAYIKGGNKYEFKYIKEKYIK